MKTLLNILILSFLSAGVASAHCGACGTGGHKETEGEKSHSHDSKSASYNKKDIVDIAASSEDFSTLVAAVKAAGLVETLKSEGPFTVFAPTNGAFAKLPEGTVASLLKPENKEKLIAILTYHVVPGKVMAADVKTMAVKTVQGSKANLKVKYGKVMIDGANIVKTDLEASNGVIHVIDSVIMPEMSEEVAQN